MRRRNPVLIDCLVSLQRCICEKPENGHSSQLHDPIILTHFLTIIIVKFKNFSLHENFEAKAKTSPQETLIWLTFDGPLSKIVCNGMMYYHAKYHSLITNRGILASFYSIIFPTKGRFPDWLNRMQSFF